jgi:Rod binding domain-containing protein
MDFLAPPVDAASALGARKPPAISASGDAEAVGRTAQDFEAFFLSQMFEHMFSGVEPDAMFGGGQGEEVFRSMLFQEYGKAVAKQGGIGLSDMVQKEMLKLQEAQQP